MKRFNVIFALIILMSVSAYAQDISPYDSLHAEGKRLFRADQPQEALTVYERILLTHPDDVDALLFRGRLYAIFQRYNESERDLKRVLRAAPEYYDAYYGLVSMFYWKGDLERANLFLNTWMIEDAENPEVYVLAARIEIAQRHFMNARQYLDKAHTLGADKSVLDNLLRAINRPRQEKLWSAGINYRYEIVDSQRGDWKIAGANIIHEFEEVTAVMSYDLHVRDTLVDHAATADVYINLWEKAYLNTRFQMSLTTQFLPIADVTLELFQGMGTRSEPSIGYRLMHFSNLDVHIPSLALGYYPGNWYVRDKVSLIISDDLSWQNIASARYFIDDVDTYIELLNSLGTEFNPVSQQAVRSIAFSLRGSFKFNEQWLGNAIVSWTRDEFDIQRYALGLGLVYRW